MKTLKQIKKQISEHKYVERDTSPIIRCPLCSKLISTRFPMHECKPKRKQRRLLDAALQQMEAAT